MSEPEPMEHTLGEAAQRIVEEVRAQAPRIDWSRVEAKLFDQEGAVRDAEIIRGRFGKKKIAILATGLAIAASFTLALVSPGRGGPSTTQQVATARPALTESNGPLGTPRVLHIGDVIEAGSSGDILRAEGRLEAHLAPGSRVKLLDDGERILLSLERGTVAASVVPVAGGEPFAIDVAGRRVAVHGTKLLVAAPGANAGEANGAGNADDFAMQVVVSEGSAVVGTSHGDGRTEGTLVIAGGIGSFGGSSSASSIVVLDAGLATQRVETGLTAGTKLGLLTTGNATGPTSAYAKFDDAVAIDPAPMAPTTGDVAAKPSSGVATKLPAELVAQTTASDVTGVAGATDTTASATTPTVATGTPPDGLSAKGGGTLPPPPGKGLETTQINATMGKVLGAIRQCVPRTSSGITFSISTHMTLSIDPSGAIDAISFEDAPLDTKLAACVRGVVSKLSFPSATAQTTVTRAVVLGDKK